MSFLNSRSVAAALLLASLFSDGVEAQTTGAAAGTATPPTAATTSAAGATAPAAPPAAAPVAAGTPPATPAVAAPPAAQTAQAAPASAATPQPAEVVPAAPQSTPPLAVPTPHPTWTSADVARVRAMLRTHRAVGAADGATQAPSPVVHGDAGAPFAVGFSVDAVFYHDKGYDLFANDDVTPRFGLWAGYDVLKLTDHLFMAAELGWGVEHEKQDGVLGALHTDLVSHTFDAAASLRYVLFPWLQPQARLSAGATWLTAELQSDGEATNRDHAVSPIVTLGGGFLLRTPPRLFETNDGRLASASVGVQVEGGYALRGSASFALGDGHGAQIPLRQAELGELTLSGPYVRTSLVTRF